MNQLRDGHTDGPEFIGSIRLITTGGPKKGSTVQMIYRKTSNLVRVEK